MRPALLLAVACLLHISSATNSDAMFAAMDDIDSIWGLGFRTKFGDPQRSCNCSFVDASSGQVFPCLWTRVGKNGTTEGFFCGLTDPSNPAIDSILFDSPVPKAPGTVIPTSIGVFTSLRQLQLRGVGLSGNIPTEVNQLVNLQSFIIASNSLSGAIPDMSDLQQLYKFALSANGMIGTIPLTLSNNIAMKELYLDNNRFTGPADFVATMADLALLRLENNQFTGTVPESIGTLPRIRNIYLSNNNFSGAIPSTFKTLAVRTCDIQLNNVDNCWDPLALASEFAPYCQFNCRPCDNGMQGPPDCTCYSVQPNPAQCTVGIWYFGGDLAVNGTQPLNLAFDKAVIEGALDQNFNGAIRIYASKDQGIGGVTAQGCVTLGGPLYVDLHDIKSSTTIDVVTSQANCLSGNFSRVVVTDDSGPGCPRKGVRTTSSSSVFSIVVPSASSCTENDDGPRLTKPIIIGIITGTIAVALVIIGVILLVVFIKKTSASSRTY